MASTNLMSMREKEKEEFLKSFDYFISDCDGKLKNYHVKLYNVTLKQYVGFPPTKHSPYVI